MRSILKAGECLGTPDWSCPRGGLPYLESSRSAASPCSSYIGGRAGLEDTAAAAADASFQREPKVRGEAEFVLDSVSVGRVAHF